jgi:hypothetical protein
VPELTAERGRNGSNVCVATTLQVRSRKCRYRRPWFHDDVNWKLPKSERRHEEAGLAIQLVTCAIGVSKKG